MRLSWTITACDGTDLATGGEAPYHGCVELGENYVLNLQDSVGDGWGGTEMIIEDNAYTLSNGFEQSFVVGSCGIAGCMDALACNFDSTATFTIMELVNSHLKDLTAKAIAFLELK